MGSFGEPIEAAQRSLFLGACTALELLGLARQGISAGRGTFPLLCCSLPIVTNGLADGSSTCRIANHL